MAAIAFRSVRGRARWFAVLGVVVALGNTGAARVGPPTLFKQLGAGATWKTGLPSGFSVARAVSYPSGDPGVLGQVFVYLKGPFAGQGIGFLVTSSQATAADGLIGIVRDHQAKPAVDGPAGSFRWTATDIGATSACDSPQVTCYETSRAVQIGKVVVVATVGSIRRGDHRAWRLQSKLFAAAIARLKDLGG